MRRQCRIKLGPFFWGESQRAASSNASREARLIQHRFFDVGLTTVVWELMRVKSDFITQPADTRAMRNEMVSNRAEKWQRWRGPACISFC